MQLQFTEVFRKVRSGYVGFVEELPGANTQGTTLAETRANLAEAVHLVLEANRALAEEALDGATVIREPLRLGAAWNSGISYGTSKPTVASCCGRERSTREVDDFLAHKICRDLDVPRPDA